MHYDPNTRCAFDDDGLPVLAIDPADACEDAPESDGALAVSGFMQRLLEISETTRSTKGHTESVGALFLVAAFISKVPSAPRTLQALGASLGMTAEGARKAVLRLKKHIGYRVVQLERKKRKPQ